MTKGTNGKKQLSNYDKVYGYLHFGCVALHV